MSEDVACCHHEENSNHHAHSRSQRRVHASGSFHPLDVEQRKYEREEDSPDSIAHPGGEHVRLLAAPDRADNWVEHVIHHHAPPGDVTEGGIDLLSDVSERGTG